MKESQSGTSSRLEGSEIGVTPTATTEKQIACVGGGVGGATGRTFIGFVKCSVVVGATDSELFGGISLRTRKNKWKNTSSFQELVVIINIVFFFCFFAVPRMKIKVGRMRP